MNSEYIDHAHTLSHAVLDAGGWFDPYLKATHVVDLMPYETRGGKLQLDPLPGERFTKATWHQVNFLNQGLKLPFPDKFFDFSVCGHTIEDLANPVPLLNELRRVSKSGYIETPSRILEQTVGARDRMTDAQGHPHHHWIVDVEDDRLLLSSKINSLRGPRKLHAMPLRTYERLIACKAILPIMSFNWHGTFYVLILPDDTATTRAHDLINISGVSAIDRLLDFCQRKLRLLKSDLFCPPQLKTNVWWQEMLKISRPFSTIPL
ncbi:MAG: class I SAM-dependent methyltransferase [Cephaloticoccus sp.]|nr:class I SAM-dependent methyltransferase [Cephaloticoccus sp.]